MFLPKTLITLLMVSSLWVSGNHKKRHHHRKTKQMKNFHHIVTGQGSLLFHQGIITSKNESNKVIDGLPWKRENTAANKRASKDDALKAAKSLVDEISDINLAQFTGKNIGKAQKGLSTSLGAAESLYEKYQKKDKMGMVMSGLTVASGLASMVGGPVGFIVAMTLDVIKTIISIVDKKKNGPPESESSKLQKAIEKALRKFTQTELSADWNGYKRLTEVYLKHLEMIETYDEIKPLEGKNKEKFDIEDMGGKEEVKQQLFDEVTPQIYKVLMASTHLLGKIEHHITKVCDFDIQARKVKSKFRILQFEVVESEPIPKQDEIDEKDVFATNCLKMYELYAKISSYHFQTYLKSLEAIHRIVGEKYFDARTGKANEKQSKADAKESKSKRKAYVFMHLLLDMIQNSREYNKKVFKPFLNPFDYYKMRYTVNYYYNNEKMYEHMSAYLQDFFNDEETMKKIPKKVMFCSQQSLLGSCYLSDGKAAQKPGPWRSAYVPKGKSITVEYQSNPNKEIVFDEKIGLPIKLIGPSSMGMLYTMKMLYPSKTGEDYSEKVKKMKKFETFVKGITIGDEPEPPKDPKVKTEPAKKLFKMCVSADYLQENPTHHASVCITDEFEGKVKSIMLSEIKSPTQWKGKNISLSCSEPDMAFVGTYKTSAKDVNLHPNLDARWGPFFSPFPMTEMPGSVRWDSITVYPYKNDDESSVKAIEKNDNVCKGDNNLLCQPEAVEKKLFVTICKQPELKGYCEEIPILKSQLTGTEKAKKIQLTVINGNGIYGKIDPMKSMYPVATQKEPDSTALWHTETFTTYYDVDNSVWEPLIRDGGKKAYNLLQSLKVPDDILVELYTKKDAKGEEKMFGPYQGPLTVDRIDGNDVISNVIYSIVIKYSPSEIPSEDSTTEGAHPDIQVPAENQNMPNDAQPDQSSLEGGATTGDATTQPN